MKEHIMGYMVFKPDWTFRGFQFTCPGTFKAEQPDAFHFCMEAVDCFRCITFDPANHVAEVLALGEVVSGDSMASTNEIQILWEIPWTEVLELSNAGKACTEIGNSGSGNSGSHETIKCIPLQDAVRDGRVAIDFWLADGKGVDNRDVRRLYTLVYYASMMVDNNTNTGHDNTGHWNIGDRNTGDGNTGHDNTGGYNSGSKNTFDFNTGDRNSGYRNGGNWNTGDRNVGNRNTGNCNIGNYNTGHDNTGDCNTGSKNAGAHNTGDRNGGNRNTGDHNSGGWNTGCCNSGRSNCGDRNGGNRNSGNLNSGDGNTGYLNTGHDNSGDWNTGDRNSGYRNGGNWNTGNHNTGNFNTGDWNSGDSSSGCFNTNVERIRMFNRPSNWTAQDWRDSKARRLLEQIGCESAEWVRTCDMTDDEKATHPEHEITGGFLRKVYDSEKRQNWWRSLNSEEKEAILSLPNFDKGIFESITGINVDDSKMDVED